MLKTICNGSSCIKCNSKQRKFCEKVRNVLIYIDKPNLYSSEIKDAIKEFIINNSLEEYIPIEIASMIKNPKKLLELKYNIV